MSRFLGLKLNFAQIAILDEVSLIKNDENMKK
jgi:hypothetical protein